MITGFNNKKSKKKNNAKLIINIAVVLLFIVWLYLPPRNKIAQFNHTINNTKLFFAELYDRTEEEWIFHRNNAIYLAQMGKKEASLLEIDNAVSSVPNDFPEHEMQALYYDRAQIRLYFGEYKMALSDYLKVKNTNIMDLLKIAMLFKSIGNNKAAVASCNSIIDRDSTAYAGYACLADVYANAGKAQVSVKLLDLLIDRVPNKSKYYLERASYKKLCGDNSGYNEDMAKAKELASSLDNSCITEEALHPKVLNIAIRKK